MTGETNHIAHFYLRENPPVHNLSPHKNCIAGLVVITHPDTGKRYFRTSKSRICDRLWTNYDSTLAGLTAINSAQANQIKNPIEPTSSILYPAYLGVGPCVHLSLSERLRRLKSTEADISPPKKASDPYSPRSPSCFARRLKQQRKLQTSLAVRSVMLRLVSQALKNGQGTLWPQSSRKSFAGTPCETSKSNPVEIRQRDKHSTPRVVLIGPP